MTENKSPSISEQIAIIENTANEMAKLCLQAGFPIATKVYGMAIGRALNGIQQTLQIQKAAHDGEIQSLIAKLKEKAERKAAADSAAAAVVAGADIKPEVVEEAADPNEETRAFEVELKIPRGKA